MAGVERGTPTHRKGLTVRRPSYEEALDLLADLQRRVTKLEATREVNLSPPHVHRWIWSKNDYSVPPHWICQDCNELRSR